MLKELYWSKKQNEKSLEPKSSLIVGRKFLYVSMLAMIGRRYNVSFVFILLQKPYQYRKISLSRLFSFQMLLKSSKEPLGQPQGVTCGSRAAGCRPPCYGHFYCAGGWGPTLLLALISLRPLSVHPEVNGYLSWGSMERNWPRYLTICWLRMMPLRERALRCSFQSWDSAYLSFLQHFLQWPQRFFLKNTQRVKGAYLQDLIGVNSHSYFAKLTGIAFVKVIQSKTHNANN